jgi:Ca-activated chloride channel family protein
VTPSSGRMPDLFVGRPVIITGRYSGPPPQSVRVRGEAGGRIVESTVAADEGGRNDRRGITGVWARSRISELMDRALYEPDRELPRQVKSIALKYGMMSAYTSFVAVDSSAATRGDHGTSVQVAVPVPDGVRYDTTVPEQE